MYVLHSTVDYKNFVALMWKLAENVNKISQDYCPITYFKRNSTFQLILIGRLLLLKDRWNQRGRGRSASQLLTAKNIWFYCNLYLPFIPCDVEFWAATSKFCNHFWKFGCQSRKSKAYLCMTNGFKVLIYLTLISFFLHYLQE